MAAPTFTEVSPPTWTFETDSSHYQPDIPTQRPRAWDRLPKSPFARRRNGRKVWKRYEPPPKPSTSDADNRKHDDTTQKEDNGGLETSHNAKRLRSRALGTPQGSAKKNRSSKYVTTLRDHAFGTPRRKQASRRSLRPDRLKGCLITSAAEVNEIAASDERDGSPLPIQPVDVNEKLEALQEEGAIEVEPDLVQPSKGPSSEDADEVLESPLADKFIEDDTLSSPSPKIDVAESSVEHGLDTQKVSDASYLLGLQDAQRTLPNGRMSIKDNVQLTPRSAEHQSPSPKSPIPVASMDVPKVTIVEDQNEPLDNNRQSDQKEQAIASVPSGQPTSPENNLRRSSRRLSEKKKETPRGKAALETRLTPAKRDEDKIKNDYNQAADTISNEAGDEILNCIAEDIVYKSETIPSNKVDGLGVHEIILGPVNAMDDAHTEKVSTDGTPPTEDIDREVPGSSETLIGNEAIDTDGHIIRSPQSKTRSGTRFSDDTTMLRDFISRAQARKLAQGPALIADPAPSTATSPRRSSRKALANLDSNSPCRKPDDLGKRPGTPPDNGRLEAMHQDDAEEPCTDSSPVRRSTRKRVPEAAKTTTGAPSLIPVRRADGTDPVVLQKSVAQQLALVTQTNTRRNKGQSKPPAVILKNLPVEVYEEATKGGHALRNCKSVGWDQRLVYYQDGTEAPVVIKKSKQEESRPKARRLRGLGAGNGTPAPKKKTADMVSSTATPASKRASRMR
ncbi:MAG: hypothetical protein Q9222_005063 [Ikaeria aurantiellina]